jgi:hypothetical protein
VGAVRSSQDLPPSGARVSYRYAGDTVSGSLRRSAGSKEEDFKVVFHEPVWEPLAPVSVAVPLERLGSGAVICAPPDQPPSEIQRVNPSDMLHLE